jgi:hypothetical protein
MHVIAQQQGLAARALQKFTKAHTTITITNDSGSVNQPQWPELRTKPIENGRQTAPRCRSTV